MLERAKTAFNSLVPATLVTLHTNITKRLDAKFVDLVLDETYDHASIPDASVGKADLLARGHTAIANLRSHECMVGAAMRFVMAVTPQKTRAPVTHQYLQSCFSDLQLAGVVTSTYPLEMVLTSAVHTALTEKQPARLTGILSVGGDFADFAELISVSTAHTDKRVGVQARVLTMVLVELLKKRDNSDSLSILLKAIDTQPDIIQDAILKADLLHLTVLHNLLGIDFDADGSPVPPEMKVIDAAVDHMKLATTDIQRGWKVYELLVDMEKTALQYARDCSLDDANVQELSQLEKVRPFVADEKPLDLKDVPGLASEMRNVIKRFRALELTASKRFARIYEKTLDVMNGRLANFLNAIFDAHQRAFWTAVLGTSTGVNDGKPPTAAQLAQAGRDIVSATNGNVLTELVSADELKDLNSRWEARRVAWQHWQQLLKVVGSRDFGSHSPEAFLEAAAQCRQLRHAATPPVAAATAAADSDDTMPELKLVPAGADDARQEEHRMQQKIWFECGKPDAGIVFIIDDFMTWLSDLAQWWLDSRLATGCSTIVQHVATAKPFDTIDVKTLANVEKVCRVSSSDTAALLAAMNLMQPASACTLTGVTEKVPVAAVVLAVLAMPIVINTARVKSGGSDLAGMASTLLLTADALDDLFSTCSNSALVTSGKASIDFVKEQSSKLFQSLCDSVAATSLSAAETVLSELDVHVKSAELDIVALLKKAPTATREKQFAKYHRSKAVKDFIKCKSAVEDVLQKRSTTLLSVFASAKVKHHFAKADAVLQHEVDTNNVLGRSRVKCVEFGIIQAAFSELQAGACRLPLKEAAAEQVKSLPQSLQVDSTLIELLNSIS